MRRTVVRVHYVYVFSWSPNFTCVSGCGIDSALARDKQVAIWHFLPSGVFAPENVMQISHEELVPGRVFCPCLVMSEKWVKINQPKYIKFKETVDCGKDFEI